jgi:hypothetical protein
VPGAPPGVLFCGGYTSDMTGTKALALEAFCRDQGRAFTRFDYAGHGGRPAISRTARSAPGPTMRWPSSIE